MVTPDGSQVYVSNYDDGTVTAISTADGTPHTITVAGRPTGLAVSPDGTRVFVANQAGYISIIDTSDDTDVGVVSVGQATAAVAISPDGTRAYVTIGTIGGTQGGVAVIAIAPPTSIM